MNRLRFGIELTSTVSAVALSTLALWHVTSGNWHDLFFYDGDSLVLPMLGASLTSGEPFEWTLSSQYFFFPEAPLFAISSVIGGGPKAALAVNALINALALYGLLRWNANWLIPDTRATVRPVAAVIALAVFVAAVFMETEASYNGSTLASLFLTTTYYYGATLSALLCCALILHLTRGLRVLPTLRKRSSAASLAALMLVVAATTMSNPLFIPQFLAPSMVALSVMTALRRIPLRVLLALISIVAVPSATGYLLRFPLARFGSADASTYVHPGRIQESAAFLLASFRQLTTSAQGILEALIVTGAIVAAVLLIAASLRERRDAPQLFLGLVAVLGPIACLMLTLVSGSLVTRYLIPVHIFPLLGVIGLFGIATRMSLHSPEAAPWRSGRIFIGVKRTLLGSAVATFVITAALAVRPISSTIDARPFIPGERCLTDWLGDNRLSGAGSFWTTRPLNLYGDPSIDLMQVNFDLTSQAWMVNLASFRNKTASYFLASHEANWSEIVESTLGPPQGIIQCGPFDIYDYRGTTGAATLTQTIRASLASHLTARGYEP